MDSLEEARNEIGTVDREMAALFERRMKAAEKVAAYKKERGLPVLDEQQETRVKQRNSAYVKDPEIRSYYLSFLADTLDVSKQYQHRLMEGQRVAYCGVEGAFAYIAATRIFPDGTPVSHSSFEEAYTSVVQGDCDCAVLPIENSDQGEVGQVIDLMLAGNLYLNGVYDLQVSQNLLGVEGATRETITKVVSHPQALGQCEAYIRKHGYKTQQASNTAIAAQSVAEAGDITLGAIASEDTARLYGLQVLDYAINKAAQNTTRFAVFSRVEYDNINRGEEETFVLLFTVKHVAGALARAIDVISSHGFNMKALRSRPVKGQNWQYYFYVEAEGDDQSEEGRSMLEDLAQHCDTLKVVGRYVATPASLQEGSDR